jgi:hypothetical protein
MVAQKGRHRRLLDLFREMMPQNKTGPEKQRNAPPFHKGTPGRFFCFRVRYALQGFYVLRSRAFLALFDIETHALTLMERLKTAGLDSAEMNENIAALIFFDEAETLLLVEPLHCSF